MLFARIQLRKRVDPFIADRFGGNLIGGEGTERRKGLAAAALAEGPYDFPELVTPDLQA